MKSFNPETDLKEMRKFGEKNELEEFDLFNILFKKLIKSENRFDVFDFYNDEYLIELKTRTNKYNKYPSTMISMNKINYNDKKNRKKVFIFKFIDGIYRWDLNSSYTEKLYNNRKYAYININCLEKIK